MNTLLKNTDTKPVVDAYRAVVGFDEKLFSLEFKTGVLAYLRAPHDDGVKNPFNLGGASYDAFDYGLESAKKWVVAVLEGVKP